MGDNAEPRTSNVAPSRYPTSSRERTRWILERRGARRSVDPRRAVAVATELELAEDGAVSPVGVIFLANRECPWRCLMCDLWKDTLEEPVPPGAIPEQIRRALARLPGVRRVKLYNAGSFFDPRAIPPADDEPIAALVDGMERVTVESHPALVGRRCFRFAERLSGRLEVALGLETASPEALERLNKGMTLESYRRAAGALAERGVALRTFLLVGLPFFSPEESLAWTRRSIDAAFDAGSGVVSLIPTRAGNGALDALAAGGEFVAPTLSMLEEAAAYGVGLARGRVLADLWDAERLRDCAGCFASRVARLARMNQTQSLAPPVACELCGGGR